MMTFAVAVSVLAIMVAGAIGYGARLPEVHRFERTRLYSSPPDELWTLLETATEGREWKGLSVEVLESDPPRRLVQRIVEDRGPFSGTWAITLDAVGDGTQVVIAEVGTIANPLARLLARHVLGEDAFVKAFLDSLSRRSPSDGPTEG